jgi:hypothetical protein
VHGHFPIPLAHEELAYSNPPEWERQMLYYVDDGAQRVGESWDDYLRRASRAIVHMGIEVRRRPAPPPNQDRQAQRRWQANIELQEADHRDWMDPTDEAYNPRYAMKFLAEADAQRARNAQRRATAAALLRREFAAIGYRNFTHSLAPDESSDELFTHDHDSRPLFGDGGLSRGTGSQPSRGRAPQPRKGVRPRRGTALQPTRGSRPPRGGAGQPRGSTRETRGPNHPLQAGGLGGQGQGVDEEAEEEYEEEYSEHRCLPCGKRKIGCSVQKTGFPCDNCKRTGRNCVRLPLGKRGVKSGDRRGGYNKSDVQRRKEEDKRREGGGRRGRKKVVDEEDEDDEEDEEDIPELNDDDESDDEQPPPPPSPPPPPPSSSRRKRHREPTPDYDQQEEPEPRPKKRKAVANTESGTRNTPNPRQQPREKPNNRSSGRRRIVQPGRVSLSGPDNWCSTCKKNLRSCDGNRPCQECLIHGEVDCNAETVDQPYRPPRETMTTPLRNQPSMTGYPTPVSGGPRQTYDAPAPSSSMVSQDMETIDVDAPPLQDYLNSQRRIVPNATAEAVREEASGGWRGGRETTNANAEDIENPSEDVTLGAPDFFSNEVDIRSQSNANTTRNNTSDNAADPERAQGPSQNPALPAYDGTTAAPGPQARQQAHSSRAITNPVNPHIGIMRAPSNNSPDMSKRCDEPIPPPDGPKCKERPTQSCDWIGHAWYNVCKDCDGKAGAGDFGLDEVVLAQTQNHMCSECAQGTKIGFTQHPTSEIQARECLCIGQIRMAWLCGTHRNEATQYVEGRAKFFEYSRKTRGLYGKCPVCDDREGDDSTGVWECGACRETVIAP